MADVQNEVPESVQELAKSLKKDLKHSDTGVGELPKDIYEKHLPEGLTMDTIKKFQSHNSDFLAALSLANGESSAALMKKKKDLASTNIEIKVGKDTMGCVYTREKIVTIPGNPPIQKTTYGHNRPFYEAYAAGPNRGALKKVNDFLKASAAAAAAA